MGMKFVSLPRPMFQDGDMGDKDRLQAGSFVPIYLWKDSSRPSYIIKLNEPKKEKNAVLLGYPPIDSFFKSFH